MQNRAAVIRHQERTIEGLKGVVNELLEENHELKQQLIERYDAVPKNQSNMRGKDTQWIST